MSSDRVSQSLTTYRSPPTDKPMVSWRGFEPFRGDCDALSIMVQEAWRDDPAALLYDARFLKSQFESPKASLDLAPTLYKDGQPAAFVAGFPRQVIVEGRPRSLAISAYLSVAPAFKRFGLGAVALRVLVEQVAVAGHDGVIVYCVDGGPMNAITLAVGARLDVAVKSIFTVRHLSRPLFPRKTGSLNESHPDLLVETLVGLGARAQAFATVGRQWSIEEAAWQCAGPYAIAERLQSGPRIGLLTGRCVHTAAGAQPMVLLIEDILWGDLEPDECALLLSRFLDRASARGAQLAVTPDLGYANLTPLRAARFRPNQRVLNTYLFSFDGEFPAEPLQAMYVKVF